MSVRTAISWVRRGNNRIRQLHRRGLKQKTSSSTCGDGAGSAIAVSCIFAVKERCKWGSPIRSLHRRLSLELVGFSKS